MLVMFFLSEAALDTEAYVVIVSLAVAVFIEQLYDGHITIDSEDALALLGKVLLVQDYVCSGRTPWVNSSGGQPPMPDLDLPPVVIS